MSNKIQKSNPLIEGKTKSCMKKYNGELPTTTPKPRPSKKQEK